MKITPAQTQKKTFICLKIYAAQIAWPLENAITERTAPIVAVNAETPVFDKSFEVTLERPSLQREPSFRERSLELFGGYAGVPIRNTLENFQNEESLVED
jgi:hypothetical protein